MDVDDDYDRLSTGSCRQLSVTGILDSASDPDECRLVDEYRRSYRDQDAVQMGLKKLNEIITSLAVNEVISLAGGLSFVGFIK